MDIRDIDIEKVAEANEEDAGKKLVEIRQGLKEMNDITHGAFRKM